MSRFESRGIEHQYSATSASMAHRAFATSCNICCTRGIHLECDKCGILTAHNLVTTLIFNERRENVCQ